MQKARRDASHTESPRPSCRGALPLLPMHLPKNLLASLPKSRRRRSRVRCRLLAWRWAELLVGFFAFWELGSPASEKNFDLGPYEHSEGQLLAFHNLVDELVPFCRLTPSEAGVGRGQIALQNLLRDLELGSHAAGDSLPPIPGTTALPVRADRVSLPTRVGHVRPEVWLPDRLRRYFLEPWRLDLPADKRPAELARSCHLVEPAEERLLARKLLSAGVAEPVPEENILTLQGILVLAGLFSVPHKLFSDRLIIDRRPQNSLEYQLLVDEPWPQGCQLCHLELEDHEALRATCRDLRSFYFQLKWRAPERNAFGRQLCPDLVQEHGGDPRAPHRLGLSVVGMGNINATTFAHSTHSEVLKQGGLLKKDRTLSYGSAIPRGPLIEGLIIDDYGIFRILPKRDLNSSTGPDVDMAATADRCYADAGLETASEKAQAGSNFVIWGTEARSEPGSVGAPVMRRRLLAGLALQLVGSPVVEARLLRRVLGLFGHPLQHRRCLFSAFHRIYHWRDKLTEGKAERWASDVRSELAAASLLLPLAVSNIRWPVHPLVACCDATPQSGGSVLSGLPLHAVRDVYRHCEVKGECVRFDMDYLRSDTCMPEPPAEIQRLMSGLPWRSDRSHEFTQSSHVNLQELREIKNELVYRSSCCSPCRVIVGTDSRVVLGCWSKGRSSSRQINGLLRTTIGWQILSRTLLVLFWLSTSLNPADHPSRLRDLPQDIQASLPDWVQAHWGHVLHQGLPRPISWLRKHGVFLEVFCGAGGLSLAVQSTGRMLVLPGIEAFPHGKYVADGDILTPHVFAFVKHLILCGVIAFIHFGTPCGSWGSFNTLNGGSRTSSSPQGSGDVPRKVLGNLQADATAELINLLIGVGGWFSLENPQVSYLWQYEPIKAIASKPGVFSTTFDQCSYGLTPPVQLVPGELVRKSTTVLSNLESLTCLSKRCTRDHPHAVVRGSVKVGTKWVSRAAAAGRYPADLCAAWARAIVSGLRRE